MKRKIALLAAATLTLTAAAAVPKIGTVTEAVSQEAENVGEAVTRGEFAELFAAAFLAENGETGGKVMFADVDKNTPHSEYIEMIANAGAMNGFGDNTFRPGDSITYEQALTVIVRYIYGECQYPQGYVGEALEMGIADGVTALIGEPLTRAEAVRLVKNASEYYDEIAQGDMETDGLHYSGGGGGVVFAPTVKSDAVVMDAETGSSGSTARYSNTAEYSYAVGYFDTDEYFNTEEYVAEDENVFKNAAVSPLSTFSIDTDTASYSNMRRYLMMGMLPPKGSIRTEELINYFDYDNPLPTDGTPFGVTAEVAACPWNSGNKLVKIAVQGDEIKERQPSNLVFLLDVSGSMYSVNKLPLVKTSLKMLLDQLSPSDTVAIVTYASGTGVALESTPVSEKDKIIQAIDSLRAGGSTNGAAGITLAYDQAEKSLIDGNNRIILCSDGDFNVGISSTGELEKLIAEKRSKGIYFTVLGFGMGNYKDNRMETLADNGNGSYAYIDSAREAKKVFVDEMPKTLYTIAEDVKLQVEFNPGRVREYRLVGYENRTLNNEDFDNDKKDAGELCSGSNVTVFYEIVPETGDGQGAQLKYQSAEIKDSDELMTVKVRYKQPGGGNSILKEYPVKDQLAEPSQSFRFAAAAAELGMLLNNSEYKGTASYDSVISLAREGLGEDELGFRTEFLHLVDLLRYIDK